MKNYIAEVTIRHYNLKPNTKTVWIEDVSRCHSEMITEQGYDNIVEASPFFRRLGGSETVKRTYTRAGYRVYEIISKSPDRQQKTIRSFNFDI